MAMASMTLLSSVAALIVILGSPVLSTPSVYEAIKRNDLGELKRVISGGADVNAPNDYGDLPLHRAIGTGQSHLN